MAITCSYKTTHGVQLPEAYANITNIKVNKSIVKKQGQPSFNSYSLQFDLNIYATQESRDNGLPAISIIEFCTNCDPTAGMLPTAYDYVKTTADFTNAIDC